MSALLTTENIRTPRYYAARDFTPIVPVSSEEFQLAGPT